MDSSLYLTQSILADQSLDPVSFLDDVLPPLALASSQSTTRSHGSVSLNDLSAQVQSLLSQASAQNASLSDTLTRLTDEIVRSGVRLAYEVEVLRGETIALRDSLVEGLQHDIIKFVPEGEDIIMDKYKESPEKSTGRAGTTPEDPEYIKGLRMLNQVRSRLEDVVRIFGEAMEWPLPPSEISLTSSFISVSAPASGQEGGSCEEKGQEVAKKLRDEVIGLLESDNGGQAGLEAATRRVEAIRTLATVWKGTAEEKARNRMVDSLAKIIDDRRQGQVPGQRRDSDEGPGGGIFKNLHRLREEMIYME